MKTWIIAALTLAVALPVAAQEPPEPTGERAQRVVASFLQLTEEQVADWDALLITRAETAEPLRAEVAAVESELAGLLQMEQPPADEVGALVIERRDLGEALAANNRAYLDGFEALLDEEQSGRLEFTRRAARVQPLLPAFAVYGLLPPVQSHPGPAPTTLLD